jgi:hypothetical protein
VRLPTGELPLIERHVTFLIADLAGFTDGGRTRYFCSPDRARTFAGPAERPGGAA